MANPWLVAGGVACFAAALAHMAVIAGGPDWYRAFGAGEALARAAERDSWGPALMTMAIAGMLAVSGIGLFYVEWLSRT